MDYPPPAVVPPRQFTTWPKREKKIENASGATHPKKECDQGLNSGLSRLDHNLALLYLLPCTPKEILQVTCRIILSQ